jgi:hypothetical protein
VYYNRYNNKVITSKTKGKERVVQIALRDPNGSLSNFCIVVVFIAYLFTEDSRILRLAYGFKNKVYFMGCGTVTSLVSSR